MKLEQIASGLHRWTAPHPDWKPEDGGPEGWERDVACLAWEAADRLVLIDPLVPSDGTEAQEVWTEIDALASAFKQPVVIVLTVYWHERSAGYALERYAQSVGAEVWAPRGSVDKLQSPVKETFAPGDELPGGIEALAADGDEEVVLWLPQVRALVAADVLLGTGDGVRLCPRSWLDGDTELEDVRRALLTLLDLPVELLLVSHGPPVHAEGRAALERALAA